jgi:hypothetical protein
MGGGRNRLERIERAVQNADVPNREDFARAKDAIFASGTRSTGDNLLGMEIDFCANLGDPPSAGEGDDGRGLWQDMTISRSEDAEWLITGRAHGRLANADAIAAQLSRIWDQTLRYPYREAHIVTRTSDEVRLQAVTQMAPNGLWVTADVHVDLA